MVSSGKRILAEIVQSQKGAEANSPHSSHNSSFLSIKPVGEDPLMSGQVEGFVFVGIVGFLKYRNVVCAALVKVGVFLGIHGINLKTDDPEIIPGDFTGFSNVFYRGFAAAFSCENQNFL